MSALSAPRVASTPAERRFRALWALSWAWKIAVGLVFLVLVVKLLGGL
ncbi:MAG: hypothetical protein ACREB9_08880 [Thermoplasmata archaeon]